MISIAYAGQVASYHVPQTQNDQLLTGVGFVLALSMLMCLLRLVVERMWARRRHDADVQKALCEDAQNGRPCLIAVVYRTHEICPIGSTLDERLFPDTETGRQAAAAWVRARARSIDHSGRVSREYGISFYVRPFKGLDDWHNAWRFRPDEEVSRAA